MRHIVSALFLVASLSAVAGEAVNNEPLKLKDGSYLFIAADGTMRMVDRNGKPIQMKDGVEMELDDGDMIMMENNKLWQSADKQRRHDHKKVHK